MSLALDVPLPRKPFDARVYENRYRAHCRWKMKRLLVFNWDWWTTWTGMEGSGKSTAMIWSAWYSHVDSDRRFREHWRDWIVYDAEAFLSAIESAKPGDSIMLDEAAEVWYYKEWYEEVHRVLDKAAIQIRDRCLDVHLATPHLGFIGRVAIWRIKDWCDITAPRYERGYMELLQPHRSKFIDRRGPYMETYLYNHFNALPTSFYDEYRAFKRKAAEERLAGYIEKAFKEGHQEKSFNELIEDGLKAFDSFKDKKLLRGPRGQYDFSLICYELKLSLETARAIAKIKNRTSYRSRPKDTSDASIVIK